MSDVEARIDQIIDEALALVHKDVKRIAEAEVLTWQDSGRMLNYLRVLVPTRKGATEDDEELKTKSPEELRDIVLKAAARIRGTPDSKGNKGSP